jgi:DNA polymerase/3'-5' exonuclease PolX
MKKIAIFVLIFVFACGHTFAGTLTVALFDLSGSVLTDNTGSEGKDTPYNKNMSELKKEINKLGKGDTIIVIGFGRKSDVTLLRAVMPRQAGPMNRNLIATRQAAVKKLEENMATKAKSVDNARTDIIGSLFRASRIIEEYEGSESPDKQAKRLLIYSDMLDNENAGLS